MLLHAPGERALYNAGGNKTGTGREREGDEMNDMFIGHSAGWYEPPDEATHWECDKCGQVWDSFYLNKDKRGYEWICDECLEEMGEETK